MNLPLYAYPGVTYANIASAKPVLRLVPVSKTSPQRCDFCGSKCRDDTTCCTAWCYAAMLDDLAATSCELGIY